jgi:trimeric autotransporter adhesin
MNRRTLVSLLAVLHLSCVVASAAALGTAFTYQGRLTDNGTPFTGTAEFQPTLWDAVTNGSQIAVNSPATVSVSVSNGLFVLPLDFGSRFSGEARWLQLEVRTTLASFTLLSPRQPLTPTPYALNAASAGGLLSLANAPLDMTVSGQRALRLEPATNGGPNVIGGSSKNFASAGVSGATIGGGGGQWRNGGLTYNYTNQVKGDFGTVSGGAGNTSSGDFATVSGGVNNISSGMGGTVGGGGYNTNTGYAAAVSGGLYNLSTTNYATVGGGVLNTSSGTGAVVSGGGYNLSSGYGATVGGGQNNLSTANYATVGGGTNNTSSDTYATVGGGWLNTSSGYAATVGGGWLNTSSGSWATVGGGCKNTSSAYYGTVGGGVKNTNSGFYATVSGGEENTSSGEKATVGGGWLNTSSAYGATVGGGYHNTSSEWAGTVGGGTDNTSSNVFATVPGGAYNIAGGQCSFAAGQRAQALHDGAFVWGDSNAADVASTNGNSWTVRASGGVRFFANSGATVGAYLPPGGNGFNPMSDRNVKENFKPVNPRAVLEKVSRLPVTEWNLISQPDSIRHIGPMAQDFQAAFGVGEDDKHISTSDADGVALAAIQGLNQVVKEKDARIEKLEQDVSELKAMVETLLRK